MKLILLMIIALLPMFGQIRAGCTPNSVTVDVATKMAVSGVWPWNCYAENLGATPANLSLVGFALDFIELEQVNQGDVVAIFQAKQAESGWAKTGRYAGYAGLAALVITGQGYIAVTAKAASTIGLGAYGATQLQKYAVTQEPSIANAIAGMLTADQILQPGTGISWKVYASNTGNPLGPTQLAATRALGKSARLKPLTPSLGPKILTRTQAQMTIPPTKATEAPPLTKPAIYEPASYTPYTPQLAEVHGWEPEHTASWETPLQPSASGPNEALDYALLWMRTAQ